MTEYDTAIFLFFIGLIFLYIGLSAAVHYYNKKKEEILYNAQ